jgi:hypothetical protein
MYTGSLGAFANDEHWIFEGTLEENGEAVDLSAATIEFYVAQERSKTTALLTATLANGKIVRPTSTSMQITFTPSDVSAICAGTYSAFMRVTIDSVTTQVIAGTLQVLEGGPAS